MFGRKNEKPPRSPRERKEKGGGRKGGGKERQPNPGFYLPFLGEKPKRGGRGVKEGGEGEKKTACAC